MAMAAKITIMIEFKQKASFNRQSTAYIRLIGLAINTGYSNPPHFKLMTNSSAAALLLLVYISTNTYARNQ
ncbi:hypothetical protein DERF_011865 [Dermatophagoides farinae]|uniref:Uncharacterized protein n=1 Tax=Dermatophagoides farinae TaxID=6954 RepID=A0A922KWD2_DERFA|nr:hypothetical protein DERF_011865 [Dermatophagoides farinae]